nr:MAG TPA: hypothetical protein [Caudoviricetes sp.]
MNCIKLLVLLIFGLVVKKSTQRVEHILRK